MTHLFITTGGFSFHPEKLLYAVHVENATPKGDSAYLLQMEKGQKAFLHDPDTIAEVQKLIEDEAPSYFAGKNPPQSTPFKIFSDGTILNVRDIVGTSIEENANQAGETALIIVFSRGEKLYLYGDQRREPEEYFF